MQEINRLLDGFRRFRRKFFEHDKTLYRDLCQQGQSPRALVIACSDSRVDPAILTDAEPGDLFVVRNVANLVPPCAARPDNHHHGTSAALEFAVRDLGVRHIIVLGHARCGGINALMRGIPADQPRDFIANWMKIASGVRDQVLRELPGESVEVQARAAEMRSVVASLDNLRSFPWVAEKIARGDLFIHGWYFDIDGGELHVHDPQTGNFRVLDGD